MEDVFATGIMNFDRLINGGFLPGHKVSVYGGPGAAKSIFCAQFIYNGVTKYGQSGIYISTQEKKNEFYNNMKKLGMDFEAIEKQGKFKFIEQGLVKKEFYDIVTLLDEIHSIGAKRIVFDSVNFFDIKYPEMGIRNIETLAYMRSLSSNGRVSLWVSENYMESHVKYKPDHFLSDGIILMQHLPTHKGPYNRTITILKLRGVNHDHNINPFIIDSEGIKVKKI